MVTKIIISNNQFNGAICGPLFTRKDSICSLLFTITYAGLTMPEVCFHVDFLVK